MTLSTARKITVAAAFVLVVVGLIFNTGTGTISSFGWQQIAAICPLGIIEGFLASKTIFARALIVLGAALLFFGIFGKVFCAWLCPVPTLKELVQKIKVRKPKTKKDVNPEQLSTHHVETSDNKTDQTGSYAALSCTQAKKNSSALSFAEASEPLSENEPTPLLKHEEADVSAQHKLHRKDSSCVSGCSGCAEKRKKFDSRHIVLGGTLLSAALFGFPVFCLICPIGLTFGTIIIFWQWIGFNDISVSLLIYPAVLIVELVVLKKWCSKFCPLGALLSLMSLPNRFLRPKVDSSKCLRTQGLDCMVCVHVCPENLDPHETRSMNECSKCGLCIEKCPATAITLPFLRKKNTKSSLTE